MIRSILAFACILLVLLSPELAAEPYTSNPDLNLRDLFRPDFDMERASRAEKPNQDKIAFSAPDDELIFTYENSALWSGMKDVYISGIYAFCSFNYGLAVLDIGASGSPRLVSQLFIADGDGWRIDLNNDRLYLANGNSGLKIVDISDIEELRLLSSLETNEYCYDVRVVDQTAYIADGYGGFLIADVSDPENPWIIAEYLLEDEVVAVDVRDNLAYIADGRAGLKIIDVTEPEEIVSLGAVSGIGYVIDIDLDGDYAYLASQTQGLRIIDIFDPSNPDLVEIHGNLQGALGVTVSENYAYVTYGNNPGLRIFDITDPRTARLINTIEIPGSTLGVKASDNQAFVAGLSAGLQLVDISNPAHAFIEKQYSTPGKIQDIDSDDDYVYVARRGWDIGNCRIQIVQYSDLRFQILSEIEFEGPAITDLQIAGNYLYLIEHRTGFHIIDVSDPLNPFIEGSMPVEGKPLSLHISGEKAYIGVDSAGLLLIDISEKNSPQLIGIFANDTPINGISSDQQFVYLADAGNSYKIIDISSPQNPVLTGILETQGKAMDLEIAGDMAYLIENKNGLQVIQNIDRENPALQQSLPAISNGVSIKFDGNYLYTSHNFDGIASYSARIPDDVYFAGSYPSPGYAWDAAVIGDNTFIADYYGLIVLKQEMPFLAVSPDTIKFEGNQDGYDPNPQDFTIENSSVGKLRWSAKNSKVWLTLSQSAGEWSADITASVDITGLMEGIYYDTIVINSNASNSSAEIMVEFTVKPTNHAPILSQIENKSVDENSSLVLDVIASDEDGTSPQLKALNLPENSSFADNGDGSGLFEFNPDFDQAGEYSISFIAIDDVDSRLSDSIEITITVNNINRVPFFETDFAEIWIFEDNLYELLLTASDYDNDPITLTCSGKPNNAEFVDSANGRGYLKLQSDFSNAGQTYHIVIEAVDSFGDSVVDSIVLHVDNRQLEVIQVDPNPPGSGIKDVLISDDINVIFNEAIDETTLEDNIEFDASSGDLLEYHYDPELKSIIISSAEEYFSVLDTINILISSEVTDLAGFPLGEDISQSLITGVAVYPGDTDNDGIVDERDILPLGVHWNSDGPIRVEGEDCTWQMFPAHQWDPLSATFADADGSGVVDADDICGIAENWELTHSDELTVAKDHTDFNATLKQVEGNILEQMYYGLIECKQSKGKDKLLKFLGSMIEQHSPQLPKSVELYQNFPNPFNPTTSIQYSLDSRQAVRIDIFDIRGRQVAMIVDDVKDAGVHQAYWNGRDDKGTPAASGIYFYRLKTGDHTLTKKMILLK
ncbi:MAG: T9SS type A sorting domain-containing protein [candidate division Zixibacteria bacterium]|nr:T9SS type A sorting domain-containing protein [candidate division Zixibacteria bacterium]